MLALHVHHVEVTQVPDYKCNNLSTEALGPGSLRPPASEVVDACARLANLAHSRERAKPAPTQPIACYHTCRMAVTKQGRLRIKTCWQKLCSDEGAPADIHNCRSDMAVVHRCMDFAILQSFAMTGALTISTTSQCRATIENSSQQQERPAAGSATPRAPRLTIHHPSFGRCSRYLPG